MAFRALFLVLFMLLSAGITTSAQSPITIKQEEVVVLPDNYVDGSLVFSASGETYAFIVQDGDQYVMLNGEREPDSFRQIGRIRFSPDNKLFYWALDASTSQQRIVLVADGEIIPTELNGEGSIVFSPEGNRWVSVQGTSAGVIILSDGKNIGKYADATWATFSPDGEHLAYLIQDAQKHISLVVDGEITSTYEDPQVEASEAFTAYVNGPNLPPLFSVDYFADGSLIILTQDANGWTVYHDDKPLASYLHNVWGGGDLQIINWEGFETKAAILASSITTASDAPVAAWWARLEGEEDRWYVVKNGDPIDQIYCARFWDRESTSLTPDGTHYGYSCYRQDGTDPESLSVVAVIDGQEYGPYANLWGITLSDDGQHFGYVASDGSTWVFYRDGEPYASLEYDSAWPPIFSEDGSHMVWRARHGESDYVVAVDGQELATLAAFVKGPRFDDDGNLAWIVKDGQVITRFTAILE